ncbi:MAG TPA: hypothetical protein VGE11_24815 [Pseudonocardia sp.]
MTPAPPEVLTRQVTALRRLAEPRAEAAGRVAMRPELIDYDEERRRHRVAGFGYLAALVCIGCIMAVGIGFAASPTRLQAAPPAPRPSNAAVVLPPPPVPVAVTTTSALPPPTPPPPPPPPAPAARPAAPRPRSVRPAPSVRPRPHPVTVPPSAPRTPSAAPTTTAAPTEAPCYHRRRCGSGGSRSGTDPAAPGPRDGSDSAPVG